MKYFLFLLFSLLLVPKANAQVILTMNQFEDTIISQLNGASIVKIQDTETQLIKFYITGFFYNKAKWSVVASFPSDYDTALFFLMYKQGNKNDFYNFLTTSKEKYGPPLTEILEPDTSYYWILNNSYRHYIDYVYDVKKDVHYIISSILRRF